MIGIKIAERREALLTEAQKLMNEYFDERIKMLMLKYQEEEYREAAISAFVELFAAWNREKEQPAAYLGISYRYSDILMGSYYLRLTLYGADFYLDQEPVEKSFDPPLFLTDAEEDRSKVVSTLKNIFPRMTKCEEDTVRLLVASYYHAAIYRLCEDLLEEIQETTQYRELKKAESFTIFYGRWRGEGEVLYRESENVKGEAHEGTRQVSNANSTGRESDDQGGELVRQA